MSEFWRAVVLGAVQGFTEFLPISSSGHLLLIHDGLGWTEFSLAYDVLLHLATLAAVLIYFRADLVHIAKAFFSNDPALAHDRRLGWLVILATAVTGVLAVVFGDVIDAAFADPAWIGAFFLVTSVALFASESLTGKRLHDMSELPFHKAALIGLAQAVALFPGVSRAGATMAAGLGVGLDREQSARFSFLMSIPIIMLAGLSQGLDALADPQPFISWPAAVAGAVVAFVMAYISIAGLLAFLRRYPLYVFAVYTGVLGVGLLVWRLA